VKEAYRTRGICARQDDGQDGNGGQDRDMYRSERGEGGARTWGMCARRDIYIYIYICIFIYLYIYIYIYLFRERRRKKGRKKGRQEPKGDYAPRRGSQTRRVLHGARPSLHPTKGREEEMKTDRQSGRQEGRKDGNGDGWLEGRKEGRKEGRRQRRKNRRKEETKEEKRWRW
jgi:hypothetical protein